MPPTLSERLIHARLASGFPRVKPAAEAAGITPSALYQLESGATKSLSGDTAEKLASLYKGFRIQWLISGSGQERVSSPAERSGVAEAGSIYSASHGLRIDPETIAAAIRLLRLTLTNLDLEYDNEEDGLPLAHAYEYLSERSEHDVTPDNLVDFSKRLAEKLRGRAADAEEETRPRDTGIAS